MSSVPTVLVVQNAAGSPIGRFEGWLRSAGVGVNIVKAFDGQQIPPVLDHAGLLMLGGGLLPDDDEGAPWLPAERAATQTAVAAGRPTLGICLGGQLLAHTCGGTVLAEHGPGEAGSTTLHRLPAADGDPLFGPMPSRFSAIEHHVDAIAALPDGAAHLARSDRYPLQAFRIGDSAWGVQFHPEVGADRVAQWGRDALRQQGYDPEAVIAEAQAAEPVSGPMWRAFAERFAALVRDG